MDSIIKQLTSSSYWTLNKDLCRKIGLQNTLVLQHFIDLQYKVFGGKEFYQQQDRIQDELGISERQVKQTISFLLNDGFISVEKKGIPAKNFYSISADKITSLVGLNCPNKLGQTDLTGNVELNSQRKELNKKEKEKELIIENNKYNIDFSNPKDMEDAIKLGYNVEEFL